jgi:hypothetical protein
MYVPIVNTLANGTNRFSLNVPLTTSLSQGFPSASTVFGWHTSYSGTPLPRFVISVPNSPSITVKHPIVTGKPL